MLRIALRPKRHQYSSLQVPAKDRRSIEFRLNSQKRAWLRKQQITMMNVKTETFADYSCVQKVVFLCATMNE